MQGLLLAQFLRYCNLQLSKHLPYKYFLQEMILSKKYLRYRINRYIQQYCTIKLFWLLSMVQKRLFMTSGAFVIYSTTSCLWYIDYLVIYIANQIPLALADVKCSGRLIHHSSSSSPSASSSGSCSIESSS